MSSFTVTGLRELDEALKNLTRSQSKSVSRQALTKSARPLLTAARAGAKKRSGKLRKSIRISTKLNARQRRMHRDLPGDVTVFVGSSAPHAHLVEFGTSRHPAGGRYKGKMHPGTRPQPFMRPAWDATKMQVLDNLREEMWASIRRQVARTAARRAARAARERGER